jgi:VWFA-related protein
MVRITAAIAVLLASTGHEQQPTFRGGVELVNVDVSVRERGRAVLGLTREDFEVLDNGVRQDVADVAYGMLPIDVTLGLDVSFASAAQPGDRLRKAVGQFMTLLDSDDRLKLLLFNGGSDQAVDFTMDRAVIDRALRDAGRSGSRGITETLSSALASTSPSDRRQLLIFVTDGAPGSSVTPVSLTELAHRSRATLTMIMPIPGAQLTSRFEPTAAQHERTDGLTALVRETGGGIVWMTVNADLGGPLRRALDEFRSTYVLHFMPRDVESSGFHTLRVSVNRSGLMVKARRGYLRTPKH